MLTMELLKVSAHFPHGSTPPPLFFKCKAIRVSIIALSCQNAPASTSPIWDFLKAREAEIKLHLDKQYTMTLPLRRQTRDAPQ